jgi:allatostatin receptor
LYLHSQHEYLNNNEKRTVCILNYGANMMNPIESDQSKEIIRFKIQIYYLIFFLFSYLLPLISIFVIYFLIMKKIVQSRGQQICKKKKKITLMVIAVIASFIICWTPLHVILFLQHVIQIDFTEKHITFLIISNCLAYCNSCVNPIIYGFANENFRK